MIDNREHVLAGGRFSTDVYGYQRMLAAAVIDVPAKLSARVRVFDTGQGCKTGPQ